ncbi:hypothetical protein [Persicobacter psychrovividus]
MLAWCLFQPTNAQAQYYQGQDYRFSPEVVKWVTLGKQYMDKQDYPNANIAFRRALATKDVLPTDMAYLFAETLYQIDQYKNAQNFVEKYIGLEGEKGHYYPAAIALKQKIQSKLQVIIDCKYCNALGYRLKACAECSGKGTLDQSCPRCHGVGKERCRACQGQGVKITVNQFGLNEYAICQICNNTGFAPCSLCNGAKRVHAACPVCLGSGTVPTQEICDHQPHTH